MHHELEKFLSIVEYGSFTEAAKRTHVSQPALTSAIKSLETRYNVKLFYRGTKPLKLTKAGKITLTSASMIRMEANKLSYQLKNLQDGQTLPIPIGSIDSIAMRIFQYDIHANNLEVHVDNSARLTEAVRLNRIDLAFIATPLTQPSSDDMKLIDLKDEQFCLIAHPDNRQDIQAAVLTHKRIHDFITYNPESTTFQRIATALKSQGFSYKITFASTSPELMRQAVLSKKGAALIPKSLVEDEVAAGRLCIIKGIAFKRPISLAIKQDTQLSDTHNNLIESIKETI